MLTFRVKAFQQGQIKPLYLSKLSHENEGGGVCLSVKVIFMVSVLNSFEASF